MLGTRRPRVLHGAADMRLGGSHATAVPPNGFGALRQMMRAAAGCLRGPGATAGGRPSASPDQRARFLWAVPQHGAAQLRGSGRCRAALQGGGGSRRSWPLGRGAKLSWYAADPAQALPVSGSRPLSVVACTTPSPSGSVRASKASATNGCRTARRASWGKAGHCNQPINHDSSLQEAGLHGGG